MKITKLHIRGLRSLKAVDWPADGLGWGETIPDVVLVGGVNGSGKTTLLEFLFQQLAEWAGQSASREWTPDESTLVVEHDQVAGGIQLRGATTAYTGRPDRHRLSALGGVVFFPADRSLVVPEEHYKSPGKMPPHTQFAWRWRRPADWKESLERLLWSARWEDLSNKEEGIDEPSRFSAFSDAFADMTGGTRRLKWHKAELWAETDTGTLHPLTELSDGEKQVLLLTAELRYRWRPGSIVLIDEPELHLHTVWQARLWELLIRLQKERGGQVIATTQSSDLFRLADPTCTTILGLHRP